MFIKLSPQRRDDVLEVTKAGPLLTVNGELLDVSPMGDGDTLPAKAISSEWFVGEVRKLGEDITVNLLLPLPATYTQAQAFPSDLIDVPDGTVSFAQPFTDQQDVVLADSLESLE